MNRRELLGTATCFCLCGVGSLGSAEDEVPAEAVVPGGDPPQTPCVKKMEFAKGWVGRFMDTLDAELPEETRQRLMEANGRACFIAGHGAPAKPDPPPDLDAWLAGFQQHVGKENLWREGDEVHFKYVANPSGLRVADGYCLCPLVEDGPATLSATYCHCSVGYVSLLFETTSGRKADVTLVDSLRRGGKECHFLVRLS